MFKDQESNVNKLFHLLPTRKLSISNGEVAMLAGYFACIPRYCKIHYFVTLTFKSVDENLWCYHSSETSLLERFHGSIYFLGFDAPKIAFL